MTRLGDDVGIRAPKPGRHHNLEDMEGRQDHVAHGFNRGSVRGLKHDIGRRLAGSHPLQVEFREWGHRLHLRHDVIDVFLDLR